MSFCIFDAHCDTMSRILNTKEELLKNSGHLDIERINKLNIPYIQVFASFSKNKEDIFKIIDKYKIYVENESIVHCNNFHDIQKNLSKKKLLSILSVEGADVLSSNIEILTKLYSQGVRIITLTWNYKNEIADGILEEKGAGLTDFGKSVVCKMNELGIIVDVSHLSEKGFWDVSEISSKPFVASHSNAKALCSNKRNLSDEQIKEIIKKNGAIGLNFYPVFLSNNEKASIKDIIKHAEYILSLGGENSLGLGSDFDGIDFLPDGVSGVESYYNLIEEFLKLGYKEKTVKKICSENFLRVFKEVTSV